MINRSFLVLARDKSITYKRHLLIAAALVSAIILFVNFSRSNNSQSNSVLALTGSNEEKAPEKKIEPSVDFKRLMTHIINGDTTGKWTVPDREPLPGAVLPYKRIIAYYGNLYSKQMGILGELPEPEMIKKLQSEVEAWKAVDTVMDVQPALHYICVTAQVDPGKAGKYRLRMPFTQIDKVLEMAKPINAIVFLDIQVGLGTLQEEIPELEKYLKMPNVHLGIDPEFSMKGGQKPGAVIGEYNADDINYATNYLAKLVKENNIPPKILVVHRFTQPMVKNYKQIVTRPEVQIVMHMDGWGHPAKKVGTYKHFIAKEPVEFTGFKIFYKNDMKNNGRLITPAELVKLKPQPVYIQYQ